MIAEILKSLNAIGKENAVKMYRLVALTGARTRRTVDQAIHDERDAGALICATKDIPYGYYLARDCAEAYEYYERTTADPKGRIYNLRHFKSCMDDEQIELDIITEPDRISERANYIRDLLNKT